MELKSFAQDKANHYFYGSLVAAAGAAAAMLVLVLVGKYQLGGVRWAYWVVALAGVAGAAVAALAAGLWKEAQDRAANALAEMLNHPAPHEVSRGDVQATAAGAVPVCIALLAMALLTAVA